MNDQAYIDDNGGQATYNTCYKIDYADLASVNYQFVLTIELAKSYM